MANISYAFGTMEIKIEGGENTERLLKNFKALFEAQESFSGYPTHIDEFEIKHDDTTYALATFTADGRWSYYTNIEMVYDWFKEVVEHEKYGTQELKDIWAEINKYDWEITYDYTDEEGGNEVLYTAVVNVEHKAGEDKVEVVDMEESNYDYTPENLVELDICGDIEDAREYMGLDEE